MCLSKAGAPLGDGPAGREEKMYFTGMKSIRTAQEWLDKQVLMLIISWPLGLNPSIQTYQYRTISSCKGSASPLPGGLPGAVFIDHRGS